MTTPTDKDLMTAAMAEKLRGTFLELMARPVQLADLGAEADEALTPAVVLDDAPTALVARPVGKGRTVRPSRARRVPVVRQSADESGQQGWF